VTVTTAAEKLDNLPTSGNLSDAPEFTTLVGQSYAGDISKYLSVANRAVGTIREEWAMDVLRSQGYDLGEEYARSDYKPEEVFNALKEYDGPSTWKMQDERVWGCFQRAVSKVESYFKDFYGTLSPLPLDERLWESVKKETSSGLPSLAPKRLVFKLELERARKMLEGEREERAGLHRKHEKRHGPEPAVAYYRTQASIHEDGTPKKKVRMVWGYPLSMILHEACYARPVIDQILKSTTPISLGYRKTELGAQVLSAAWWPVAGTFDWSKWDARCPTRLIMEGFRIIKKFFHEVDEAQWDMITRYFCTCPILMPNAKVYKRRRRGIPSGSYFTSLIGSICNMIAIHFLAFLQELDVVGLYVLGDDSFVGFTSNVDIGMMVRDAWTFMGMKLNLDKLAYGGPRMNPRYLGHNWFRGRIRRPVIETAQRIVYPERYNRFWWEDRLDKLISLYGDNVDAWPLIHRILVEKGFATRHGSGDQFLLKLFRDLGGFVQTESPEEVGSRKRFAAATLK
jgi:hypothetical protein